MKLTTIFKDLLKSTGMLKWSEDNYKWAEFASGIELILSDETFYGDRSVVNQIVI